MPRTDAFLLAAGLTVAWAVAAQSSTLQEPVFAPRIVINDGDGAEVARALGAPFDGVVQLRYGSGDQKYCSGTLIAPGTVLTARHCIDIHSGGNFSFTVQAKDLKIGLTDPDGSNIERVAVTSIQRFTAGAPGFARSDFFNGSDLALLTLATPVTDRTPFTFINDPQPGETVMMVGYGAHGVASLGQPTDRSLEYQGERWGALNVLELAAPAYVFPDRSPNFAPSGWNSLLYSDFDDPLGVSNTWLFASDPAMIGGEGTTAPGDSGGPLLVLRDGLWHVAGILTGGTAPDPSLWISYGDVSVWTGITSAEAQTFVLGGGGVLHQGPALVIPLPPSGLLLLGALGLAGGAMRRRRGAGGGARAA